LSGKEVERKRIKVHDKEKGIVEGKNRKTERKKII